MASHPTSIEMITSNHAPKPIGPYSHAIRVPKAGPMLFVSGQIPIDAATGKLITGDVRTQAEVAMANLKSIIVDAGFSIDDVAKCTIFLTDMKDFDVVNQVYGDVFSGKTLPARAVVQVAGLPKGVDVEIECVAVKTAE